MERIRIKSNRTAFTNTTLDIENEVFRGTRGVSEYNRSSGFIPAFYDTETRTAYRSRFADGREAPIHMLDGLPDQLIVERTTSGRARAIRETIVSGFLRGGIFYTREQAAAAFS